MRLDPSYAMVVRQLLQGLIALFDEPNLSSASPQLADPLLRPRKLQHPKTGIEYSDAFSLELARNSSAAPQSRFSTCFMLINLPTQRCSCRSEGSEDAQSAKSRPLPISVWNGNERLEEGDES